MSYKVKSLIVHGLKYELWYDREKHDRKTLTRVYVRIGRASSEICAFWGLSRSAKFLKRKLVKWLEEDFETMFPLHKIEFLTEQLRLAHIEREQLKVVLEGHNGGLRYNPQTRQWQPVLSRITNKTLKGGNA